MSFFLHRYFLHLCRRGLRVFFFWIINATLGRIISPLLINRWAEEILCYKYWFANIIVMTVAVILLCNAFLSPTGTTWKGRASWTPRTAWRDGKDWIHYYSVSVSRGCLKKTSDSTVGKNRGITKLEQDESSQYVFRGFKCKYLCIFFSLATPFRKGLILCR